MLLALLVPPLGCDTGGTGADAGGDGSVSPNADSDADSISDLEEERADRVDTDGDGILDYLDQDSDGDGIPDQIEAGDADLSTSPIDSDEDGTPDFRDLDSDENGILDAIEGSGDFDLDGIRNYADLDDDNDFVSDRMELDGILPPIDTDGDGSPNYRDVDSDNDQILDGDEFGADTDRDGLHDEEDLDSDSDGWTDLEEAGDDDVYSAPIDSDEDTVPDFRDADSDNDGLSDRLERDLGTNPRLEDSDNDMVPDLIEFAAGTDPNDPAESPLARGDFVFVVDYMQPPDPIRDTLEFRTSIQFADVYFLFDISGSMAGELAALRGAVTTLLDDLECMDSGITCRTDGDCPVAQVCSLTGTCIEDPSMSSCVASPWSGGGYYEDLFVNLLSIQDNPAATASALDVPSFGGTERMNAAVWSLLDPDASPLAETGCMPPAADRIGCAQYRDNAVRILVTFSDENSDGTETTDQAGQALIDNGVTFIGVWSGGAGSTERVDMVNLAIRSQSVDRSLNPLVFDGTDAAVVPAVAGAINEVVEGIPLRVTIETSDEPGDAGDALQFIDYLEVNVSGGRCSAVAPLEDTDSDGHPDAFPALLPGTPVCWDVVPRQNNTVERIVDTPQVFRARLTVYGDDSPLDARIVYFLVPPDIEMPGGPD
ncbi:MAG: hypothetical protein AB7S26_07880 [Sandaracinaceae bacterium]